MLFRFHYMGYYNFTLTNQKSVILQNKRGISMTQLVYRFPNTLQPLLFSQNSEILIKNFTSLLRQYGFLLKSYHIRKYSLNMMVEIRCKKCSWALIYYWQYRNQQQNGLCLLRNFNIIHDHTYLYKEHNFHKQQDTHLLQIAQTLYEKKFNKRQIQLYLRSKLYLDFQKIKEIYYILDKQSGKDIRQNFQGWYEIFKNKITILTIPQPSLAFQYPDIIFLTSDKALVLHTKRGFATGIKLVGKHRRYQDKMQLALKNYFCLVFYGFGVNEQKLIYAISVFQVCSVKNIAIVIKVFLEVTKHISQSLFISDRYQVKQALNELKKRGKFNGEYFVCYDEFVNDIEEVEVKQRVFELCKTTSENQYTRLYNEYIKKSSTREIEILQKFDEEKDKFMIWKRKKQTFIGNWLHQNPIQIKHSSLLYETGTLRRQYISILMKIYYVFKKQDRVIAKRPNFDCDGWKIQNFSQYFRLEELRKNVSRSAFRLVMKETYKTFNYNLKQIDYHKYAIHDGVNEYLCVKGQNSILYECQCKYRKLVGLPCSHLLKLLFKKKYNVEDYVIRFWKIQNKYCKILKQYQYYQRGLQVPKQGVKKSHRNNPKIFRPF